MTYIENIERQNRAWSESKLTEVGAISIISMVGNDDLTTANDGMIRLGSLI